MCQKMGVTMSESTFEGIMAGVQAVVELDKQKWIEYRGGISESELLGL